MVEKIKKPKKAGNLIPKAILLAVQILLPFLLYLTAFVWEMPSVSALVAGTFIVSMAALVSLG